MSKHGEHLLESVRCVFLSLGGLLAALKPGTGLTEGGPFSHISK